MTAHEIDELITAAARDMTRMATAGFGARVRARLGSPAQRSRVWFLAGAAVTMAAVAVTIAPYPSVNVPVVLPPMRVDLAAMAPPIADAWMSPVAGPVRLSTAAPAVPPGRRAWFTRIVPALAPAAPLALAPIDAAEIRIADLAIDPIGAAGAKQDTTVK
jgi:hypothetical protein